MNEDILYKTDNKIFSYRVAGVLINDGNLLLQKPSDDACFAVPGGHVNFGEQSATALRRELKEELGVNIKVDELLTVGEIFFPFHNKFCHQICLYYAIALDDISKIPSEQKFQSLEKIKGHSLVDFYWIPLEELDEINIYVPAIIPYIRKYAMKKPSEEVLPKSFVHKE